MFEGFERLQIRTSGSSINCVKGGSGPPLLLLHGYPQTHVMWHKVAPRLAQDQVEVMEQLGFESFLLASHDRGARVAHRLAKDHPQRVRKLAVLDIIPTHKMFQIVDKEMSTNTYHWFFLAQPYDFPERVIGADPEYFIRYRFESVKDAPTVFPTEAVSEYVRCFRDPASIHGTCEDYRAGAGIDLVHDEADLDKKVSCPLLALWSSTGFVGRTQDVLRYGENTPPMFEGTPLPAVIILLRKSQMRRTPLSGSSFCIRNRDGAFVNAF